jgi:DNA-binding winged helix-turn-helix (wHTH) protein
MNKSAAVCIDLDDERLWHGRREVPLSPKAFALLKLFVQHSRRLLTKETILDRLWPQTCVSEGLIKEYVRDLRKALGDDPKAPRYIETVHRRGYRYIGDICISGRQPWSAFPDALRALLLSALASQETSGLLHDAAGGAGPRASSFCVPVGVPGVGASGLLDNEPARLAAPGETSPAGEPRYVLEGDAHPGINRFSVSARLIDAATGRLIWTDRLDYDVNSDRAT